MIENAWVVVSALCAAFLLLTDVILRISTLKSKAEAPDIEQNKRIAALEKWKETVDRALEKDRAHFTKVDEATQVTMLALLALLDHGIDGNNKHQMEVAKEELNKHLVNR
jgi:hypothetical protein